MPLQIKKILAIIDPTTDKQRALMRALQVARRADAAVHAFLCCYSKEQTDDRMALKRAELARNEAWLTAIVEREQQNGITLTMQVEWREDWRGSFADAAKQNDCQLIVKSTYRHSSVQRRLLKTSDWALLEKAPCSVLLVKRESVTEDRRILLAVNLGVEDEEHRSLNDEIISVGEQITELNEGIELHAVNAYTGDDKFTHPPDLAERVGIDLERAHCLVGDPEDVIVDCANLLQPELVVIGTVARKGLSRLTTGNTAELALDRLDTDVLIVAHAG